MTVMMIFYHIPHTCLPVLFSVSADKSPPTCVGVLYPKCVASSTVSMGHPVLYDLIYS